MSIDNTSTSGYGSNNIGPQGESFALKGLGGTPYTPSPSSEIHGFQDESNRDVVQILQALLELYIQMANSEFKKCLENNGGREALQFPSEDSSDCEALLREAQQTVALEVARSLACCAQGVGGENNNVITVSPQEVSSEVRQRFLTALQEMGIRFREQSVHSNADAA